MTHQISDHELIEELKLRFETNEKIYQEQLQLFTQLKAVNEKLVASEELKSNFLSNIRNEINNPVASILGLAKNIAEGEVSQEAVKKFAALIYNEIFSLDFQLKNIFVSAELEAGETNISPASIKISSLLENVLLSFKHQIEKKKLELFVNANFNDGESFCSDPEKLHLILSNLIANAIQFSPSHGAIEISAGIEDQQLHFSIMDHGPGIQSNDQQIIFDRFRQIEEGSTKSYGGHGLGLCITKSLLDLLDGEIALDSKSGQGSIFSIAVNASQSQGSDIFSTEGNDFLFSENDITF
jgi:signal transduction histidine kinase